MRVLVACELSGTVRDAFAAKGHDAWSCDIEPTEATDNGLFHIKGCALDVIHSQKWDLMIAHPPCTYLCVPGAHYLHKRPERWLQMEKARDFFFELLNAKIPKKCIENPLPHQYAKLPRYSQMIWPWQFGHELTKRTCLWLDGLPPLMPTKIMENKGERYTRKDGTTSNSKWYAASNAKERSKTFQGIADAMAEQWG